MKKVLEQVSGGALPYAGSNGEVRSISTSERPSAQISLQEARGAATSNWQGLRPVVVCRFRALLIHLTVLEGRDIPGMLYQVKGRCF